MAESSSGGGGNAVLSFIVGGLLVVVAVIAFALYSGKAPTPNKSINVDITASVPKLPAPAAPAGG